MDTDYIPIEVVAEEKGINPFWIECDERFGDLFPDQSDICQRSLYECVGCMECWPDRD